MHPVLMIRSEIFCLILLLFIKIISGRYKGALNKNNSFNSLLICAIIHIIFNIAASLIVFYTNFEDHSSISYIATIVVFVLFYLSVAIFCSEYLRYVLLLLHPNNKKGVLIQSYLVAVIFIAALPFLKIEFQEIEGTYISSGIAPVACSVVAFLDFVYAFGLMILNRKKIEENVMDVLFPVSFTAISLIVVQAFISEMLSTGIAITLVTIGFFFSSENPASILQSGNKNSASSELKTNSEFKDDLARYDAEFTQNKLTKFIIARASIDNLMDINSDYGHKYGNECIEMFLKSSISSLVNVEEIYRTTGAEITAIYKNKNEDVVKNDLNSLKTSLKINGASLNYKPLISMGYAVSNETHNNLDEVLKASDYSLYKNKEEVKGGADLVDVDGVSINITGLNDYMFDAMCIAMNNSHPFILNLRTNVMRITPGLKDEFAIASDLMYDLPTVWINHIHQDDRQKFIDSFTSTVARKQQIHDIKYRALNKDGVYIKCHSFGSVYNTDNGLQLYAGHIDIFGPVDDENDDSWVK